jgi:acyl-coenzyme A thioesterase PaaI-like protein
MMGLGKMAIWVDSRHSTNGGIEIRKVGTESRILDPQISLAENNTMVHRNCFACGLKNEEGLHLNFHRREDGTVWGDFMVDSKFEGYSGIVNGGIIATLLDSAMTHCLLDKGFSALTGRLSVRYLSPIPLGSVVQLKAQMVKKAHRIFFMEGQAFVNGKQAAHAEAKFKLADKRISNSKKNENP